MELLLPSLLLSRDISRTIRTSLACKPADVRSWRSDLTCSNLGDLVDAVEHAHVPDVAETCPTCSRL